MIFNHFSRTLRLSLAALLLLPGALPAAIPSAATIIYSLSLNGILLGTITEHFEIKDHQYRASSEARASGLLALVQRDPARYVSSGAVTSDGLRPQRFEGHHRGKSLSADFDWTARTLTLAHDGQQQALALPAGAQDRLSIMYQLMFAVRDKPAQLDVTITNGRKLTPYRYAVKNAVTIDTPLRRLDTVHFVKQREAGESGSEVWIAPEYGNLPVKVLIVEDNGDRYEQVATRVEIRP